MCGIAGIIAEKEGVVRRALSAMVAAQSHRGPDDVGEEVLAFGDRWIGLGHRRLSIIDLSCAGHQPMKNPATGDRIVFNGEIYNFQRLRKQLDDAGAEHFAGHSDTEVLLHGLSRWGTDYLTRLQGMYAFGFLNVGENVLTLARDPLGIKPLYVAERDGMLLFASEVRGILASELVPRNVNMQAVAGYLAYGAMQQPLTIIEGIRSLPPGSFQQFRARSNGSVQGGAVTAAPQPQRFWSFPPPRHDVSIEQAIVEVERIGNDAVRDHLISDVPVGVFLSSGLDSTVVASLAAKHSSDMRSFTVGFADQPDMSELELAGETAKHLGLRHTEIVLNGEDAEATVWDWLESLDQPSTDGLNVYVISKAVRAHGITVALSGQGGDELFGGYPSFRDVPRLQPWVGMLSKVPRPIRRLMCQIAAVNRSKAVREKLSDIVDTDGSVLQLFLQRRRVMSNSQLTALGVVPGQLGLRSDYLNDEALQDLVDLPAGAPADVVWQVSQMESRMYQGNVLLRDGDVNGMLHGLEIRVPMLDQRLTNYVSALPGHIRLPSGAADKHLLRVAFARFLRPALLRQKKVGFALPVRRWMLGPMRDLCESALAALKVSGCLRPEGIDGVWEAYLREPESSMWTRAWALCVLGCYLKKLGAVNGVLDSSGPLGPASLVATSRS